MTISLGTLLQTAALVASAAFFIWKLQTRLEIMDHKQTTAVEKITVIERELEKLTEVIVKQAMHDQRLNGFDARLQELSEIVLKSRRLTRRK